MRPETRDKTCLHKQAPFVLGLLLTGCMTLFGWDIHAPGVLSQNFYQTVSPIKARVALFLPQTTIHYLSEERGGQLADPQIYHVGEAIASMLVEAFQSGFEEFVFLETEPTPELLTFYDIPFVVVVVIKSFQNRVTLKGQTIGVRTEAWVFDQNLKPVARIESDGLSDAKKVFAKKGGPEVNLNAAVENNVTILTQFLQDWMGQQMT